jgi:hypothetical protein
MTLLDRLKPVYREKLEQANLQHPNVAESIADDLESNEYVKNISYGTYIDMHSIFGNTFSAYDYFEEI